MMEDNNTFDSVNNNFNDSELSEFEQEYIKYTELFRKKFGRFPEIIFDSKVTKEQNLEAIKKSIEQNKDMLDEILYKNKIYDFSLNEGNV